MAKEGKPEEETEIDMSSEVEGELGVLKAKWIKELINGVKCCSQAKYDENSGVGIWFGHMEIIGNPEKKIVLVEEWGGRPI